MGRSISAAWSIVICVAMAGGSFRCSPKTNEAEALAEGLKASRSGADTMMSVTPGKAGGTVEETIKASATVAAVDQSTRKVTLKTDDGTEASFTAPPEVKNFEQIRVGDKVNATIHSQLFVYVGRNAGPSQSQQAEVITTPKGAKPGAIVAQNYETVAKVKAIDAANRLATLQFVGGETRIVPIRPDVDLTKYKVGDGVIIQVTQQLMLLVESP